MSTVSTNEVSLWSRGSSRKWIIAFLSISLMTALINSSLPTPLYPIYAEVLSLNTTALTFIYGAYATGVLVSLMLVGSFSKRASDLRVLIIPSLVIIFFAGILFSYARSFEALFIARFLTGIATGGLTGAANISLVKFGPKDNGKTAAFIAVVSFTLGLSFGPLLSGLSLKYDLSYLTFPYLFISGMAVFAILGVFFTWPKYDENVCSTRSERSGSNRKVEIDRKSEFFICSFSLFLCWMVAACILAVGPSISMYISGSSDSSYFAYMVSGYLLIAGVSQVLSKKVDAKKSLVFGYMSQIISFVIFYFSVVEKDVVFAFIGLLFAGYSYGALFVGSASLINRVSTEENHAKMISMFYMVAYTANWVPIILGRFIDSNGLIVTVCGSLAVFVLVELVMLCFSAKAKF